jgi:hypothetical protein
MTQVIEKSLVIFDQDIINIELIPLNKEKEQVEGPSTAGV